MEALKSVALMLSMAFVLSTASAGGGHGGINWQWTQRINQENYGRAAGEQAAQLSAKIEQTGSNLLSRVSESATLGSESTQLKSAESVLQDTKEQVRGFALEEGLTETQAEWRAMESLMKGLFADINRGRALAYQSAAIDSEYRSLYPGYDDYINDDLNYGERYQQWASEHLSNVKAVMERHGLEYANWINEERIEQKLSELSREADGRVRAIQAAIEIADVNLSHQNKLAEIMQEQIQQQASYYSTVREQRTKLMSDHRQLLIPLEQLRARQAAR